MSVDWDFRRDDVTYGELWTYVQRLSSVILQASTRLGLGVLSAGLAIAGSGLMNSRAGAAYGNVALGASGVFAAWFAGSVLISGMSGTPSGKRPPGM